MAPGLTNFDFPKVTLRQIFEATTTTTAVDMAVACIGPHYHLLRVEDNSASLITASGDYSYNDGLAAIPLPGHAAGNVVPENDSAAQRLVVRNGVFKYATASATSEDPDHTDPIISISADSNIITFDELVLQTTSSYVASDIFGTRGVQPGDVIVLHKDSTAITTEVIRVLEDVSGMRRSIVVGSKGDLTSVTSVDFCVKKDVVLTKGFTVVTELGTPKLTIAGGLTAPLPELGTTDEVNGELLSGDFYFEYRERVMTYVNRLGSVASGAELYEVLGIPCNENPLALAVYFAISGGTTVYFTSVADDTVGSYTEATDFLNNYQNIYSVVPATEDQDCIKACAADCIASSNNIELAIRRSLWYGISAPSEIVLARGIGTFVSIHKSTTAAAVLTFRAAEPIFARAFYSAGDVIGVVKRGAVGGAITRYTVTGTDGANTAYLAGDTASIPEGNYDVMYIRSRPSNGELVEEIIKQRCTNSERAQCVWADDVLFNGEVVGNFAVAAAAAGMRAGQPVHRPLSNLSYSFFSLAQTHGFSRTQLKQIGAQGIWIISNNDNGAPVNMRQVTTAVANNVNMDEESIVSNADNIALQLSSVGRNWVGNANINDELLLNLETMINMLLEYLTKNHENSALIGPQILSGQLESLEQDDVNRDRVYADILVQPPVPFNEFHMTLRII